MLNKHEQGSAVYGVTKHADLTLLEFKTLLGFRPQLKNLEPDNYYRSQPPTIYYDSELMDTPTNFDWRDVDGVVSKVKNQGMCGSCWAFSAAQNIEGVWRVSKNETVSLSEQGKVPFFAG